MTGTRRRPPATHYDGGRTGHRRTAWCRGVGQHGSRGGEARFRCVADPRRVTCITCRKNLPDVWRREVRWVVRPRR